MIYTDISVTKKNEVKTENIPKTNRVLIANALRVATLTPLTDTDWFTVNPSSRATRSRAPNRPTKTLLVSTFFYILNTSWPQRPDIFKLTQREKVLPSKTAPSVLFSPWCPRNCACALRNERLSWVRRLPDFGMMITYCIRGCQIDVCSALVSNCPLLKNLKWLYFLNVNVY